jgi:hypothetical protein
MKSGMLVAVTAAVAWAVVVTPIAAFADSTPPPSPGSVVDPRPAPTATGASGRALPTEPLGAHLPPLAPNQGVTVAPATTGHALKIMAPVAHQPKVMRP